MLELLLNYYIFLLGYSPQFITLLISILFHELGHYVFAKREGIYKGWALLPQPHIKMKRPYNSRWKYLSGLLFSMIVLPLWCVIFGLETVWFFILFQIGSAIIDLLIFVFYGKYLNKNLVN